MNKAELIERIVNCMIDPWTDAPEDYLYATPIDRYGAIDLIAQIRDDEESCELEPDECLPKEATPELVMEAFNCLIRARKYEARVARLANWITENECVCEYVNYYDDSGLLPVDFLDDDYMQYFAPEGKRYYAKDILRIGMNSVNTFRLTDEYCWLDKDNMQLHSTNRPFRDGILDAEGFARHIMLDCETFCYMFDHIIDDDDAHYILGCTKEAYLNED